jgi:Flp pilus assembly protein TadD
MLEPNYAHGHMVLGAFYFVLGQLAEAREQLEHSLRLDPLAIRAYRLLGLVLTVEGRFAESDQRLRAAREMMPDSRELAWMMASVYLAQGRMEDGLRLARECQLDPPMARTLAILGIALAKNGQETEAREVLRRVEEMSATEFVDPWSICRQYTALGEIETALFHLNRSLEERSTLALLAPLDPLLAPLRNNPRFDQIMAQLHLPPRPQTLAAPR